MPSLERHSPRSRQSHCTFICISTSALLFSKVASSPSPNLAAYNSPTPTLTFDIRQTYVLQVAAATFSAVSTAFSFIAFYWFCRMDKLFRHKLIMLLVFGDLIRASWLFLFGVISIARGSIRTETAFCQVGGFMIQYGIETSDFAVLNIAVHSALQVFRPSKKVHSEGLYPYRRTLYTAALVIPGIMSSLAFVKSHWGYATSTTYCMLPARPFWYRLALGWIPRYLITTIILGLAVAIYIHVRIEFRSVMEVTQTTKPSISTMTPILPLSPDIDFGSVGTPRMAEHSVSPTRRGSSTGSIFNSPRRVSVVPSVGSIPEDSDIFHPLPIPLHLPTHPQCGTSTSPPISKYETSQMEKSTSRKPSRDSCCDESEENPSPLTTSTAHGQGQGQQSQRGLQKARIHRQLRLLFIYPIVYIAMWLIPFVNHCMSYTDIWAARSPYWLTFASTICISSMGTVDCIVFSLRERPWHHISSSDGSFLGSLKWWHCFPSPPSSPPPPPPAPSPSESPSRPTLLSSSLTTTQSSFPSSPRPIANPHSPNESNPDTPHQGSANRSNSWRGSIARSAVKARSSGSSDHTKVQVELARKRLEAEKEERRSLARAVARRGVLNTIESHLGEGDGEWGSNEEERK